MVVVVVVAGVVVAEVVVEGGKAAEGANEKPCKEAEGVGDAVTLGGVG